METDDRNVTFPTFGNELNIESIVSAPLIAVSKANVMILSGQLSFLLDYCFEKVGDVYRPKMVSMEMSGSELDVDGTAKSGRLYFRVPLLSLLPLNSIAVDKLKVDFDIDVTSIGSYASNTPLFRKRAVINGKIAPGRQDGQNGDKDSATARMSVTIDVGQLPLPKGVLSLLDIYTKNIVPVSVKQDV